MIVKWYLSSVSIYISLGMNGRRRQWRPTPVLENPMDGGFSMEKIPWWAAVHGVTKSLQTWLSDFIFTVHFHALEKEMATHSSVLAWRIPGTGEPGGLPSMGSHRVGHDWSDLAAAAVMNGTEHLSMSCWPFVYLLWGNIHSNYFPFFFLGLLDFLLSCESPLYILDTRPLSDICCCLVTKSCLTLLFPHGL